MIRRRVGASFVAAGALAAALVLSPLVAQAAAGHFGGGVAGGVRGGPARPAGFDSDWTLAVTISGTTQTWYLDPLKRAGHNLSGTVQPPNPACPGQISGTISGGKVTMTFTYPVSSPCGSEVDTLSGKMSIMKGTAHGTFVDVGIMGTFTGVRTG